MTPLVNVREETKTSCKEITLHLFFQKYHSGTSVMEIQMNNRIRGITFKDLK